LQIRHPRVADMNDSFQIIDDAIAANRTLPGALLPVLHAIQDALGFIPPDAVPRIAHALNLSQAEVHGVITFYHDFRSSPPGRHVLKLCRAEACQAMGSEALAARLIRKLGLERSETGGGPPRGSDWRETSRDGAVTIEPVYCLGNCALSPALMLDGKLRGRITAEALDAIVDACRREPGPHGAEGGS
jgi:formate dehydrogenase subunit gamma